MSNEFIKVAGLVTIGLWLIVQVLLFWCKRTKTLSGEECKMYSLRSSAVFLSVFAGSVLMLD
nr:hypothetical protein [uncultured Halomonas sp.]